MWWYRAFLTGAYLWLQYGPDLPWYSVNCDAACIAAVNQYCSGGGCF